ncbi:MAG: tetratricopeptide repeat protein, partial [Candidatus Hermodarchaeia archaeon]
MIIKALQKIGCSLLVVIVVISCKTHTKQPRKSQQGITTNNSNTAVSDSLGKALAEFNRGAALLEQYKYAEAARAFETVLDIVPDWTTARFNLGLAYFNMQVKPGAKKYLKLAHEAFEAVLQCQSDHLHARFCLGLYYQHLGENEKALEYFRAVHEGDRK